jgi:flagella basal body P-ring formation protein FlgA
LPEEYSLEFKNNAFRYAKSSVQVHDLHSKKRYFLKYSLKATVKLFKARHNINRGRILTQIDVRYAPIEFTRLKSMPFDFKQKTDIRLKKRLLKGKIIYNKDVEQLPAVLKGSLVLVSLVTGTVHLEFQATALRDAHIGDEIYVEKRDKKRLRVKVIGKNQVEIQ